MTYFYMAPELYQFVLSKKADIYATACLVYFLIYKKPMWPDESIATKSIFDFVSTLYVAKAEYFVKGLQFISNF